MTTSLRKVIATLPPPFVIDISPTAFLLIRDMLQHRKNFTLVTYKDKCIRRRISLRIRSTRCSTAEEYCRLLQEDETEIDRLLKVLTIHVSQFFRNNSMFEKLRREVLPSLFQQCATTFRGPLRILSVGCASGEEPYSVGILLRESFGSEMARYGATITAIDIDSPTLAVAREAVFHADRLKELAPATISRYFSLLNNKYHLAEEVKELVTFCQGDLAVDALPEADLLLCRNVLIYLERSQQERVLISFAQALSPGGILVLGKSETLVGEARQRFLPICPVERIYRLLPEMNGR